MRATQRRFPTAVAAVALPILLACITPAHAISDEEIFRDFPFNLVNPGARALGIGGAFISLADDSTAAQANPAGLVQLRRPELFGELSAQRYDESATAINAPLDNLFFRGDLTVAAASQPDRSFSPSFLSYVYPWKRVALGFSRLESLNIQTRTLNAFSINGDEAIISVDPTTGKPVITGSQPVDFELTAQADVDAKVVQYNLALAFDLHRTFSLGLTGVVGTADVNGRVDNMFVDRAGGVFSQPTLDYATRIDDSDTDYAFNAGLHWRPAYWVSLGAVYRQGLRFVLEETVESAGVRAQEAQNIYGTSFENVIHTPDSYGFGVSFRPAEPWTILIDVVHLEFSDLLDGYVSGLNRISFPGGTEEFTVDDGNEYHLGVEKMFLSGMTPIALRFGAWSDPDHRIRAADSTDLTAAFPAGERVNHFTLGFGMTLKQSIQLDYALDVSSVSNKFVVSAIYRF